MTTTEFPAPGSSVLSWETRITDSEYLAPLSKNARALVDLLRAAEGWRWMIGWGLDTGGNAFVSIRARHSERQADVQVTFHARGNDGRLRLFSVLAKERLGWRDHTLTSLREFIG